MYNPYILNVARYAKNYVPVDVPEEYKEKILKLAKKIVAAKANELHHKSDKNAELKRFYNGLLGEAALEILLGVEIIDWNAGDSGTYDHPDIPEYNVGIKTVEYGKYPIIPKRNTYPQIICIITDTKVLVCGLADVETLNNHQNDDFIVDPCLKARGVKTAFTGFGTLKTINSIDDLKIYHK